MNREELELNVLTSISRVLGTTFELEEIYDEIMKILAEQMELNCGTILSLMEGGERLKVVAAYQLANPDLEQNGLKIGEGVAGRVVQTGEPRVIANLGREAGYVETIGSRSRRSLSGRALLCVPIISSAKVVGALSVEREEPDEEEIENDLRLLQIISSMLAQAQRISRMVLLEKEELIVENFYLREELKTKNKFDNIIGVSKGMQEVFETAALVAKTRSSVLVRGETGTGKELVARAIHYNSVRANQPFISVNCAALSEHLLESELFGHVKGAFTGAYADKKGRFEVADTGTLFLDEVGDMSPRLQVKLLRALQEQEFERVGDTKTVKVDVRVIAATNKNLEEAMEDGSFREDLYFRLNVVPIHLPPIRDRNQDIPLLIEFFLEKYNRENIKNVSQISKEILEILMDYPWPGNVRELENCVERAVVMAKGSQFPFTALPFNLRGTKPKVGAEGVELSIDAAVKQAFLEERRASEGEPNGLYDQLIGRAEKALIQEVLRDSDYVQTLAAKRLGISRNTLHKKLLEHQIPLRFVPND
ncbi:MAG: sigma 54-interacting transcriptional regulator [Planctomycetota bacterium]|jgi:Nif-specific regulatory protein|nr:sigma 54-interacting transcriptional regulator [Planctomycetota bacterium]MDP7252438.1 sigma 54-interacting transcriptional regulator [Planctomycetota bacterium]